MHGLKSVILAIFQKPADWLDWPCHVSAALQKSSQDFFSLLYIYFFFKYETIVRTSAWSFGHSDPDPSTVNGNAHTQEAVIFLLLMKAFFQQI